MSEQFKEQGGAATMDPSRLTRWAPTHICCAIWRVAHGGMEGRALCHSLGEGSSNA